MKVSIDINCTAEEARQFLGLPDVTAANEALVGELTKRAGDMAATLDPEKMMEQWMSAGVRGFGDLQQAFAKQFAEAQDK